MDVYGLPYFDSALVLECVDVLLLLIIGGSFPFCYVSILKYLQIYCIHRRMMLLS